MKKRSARRRKRTDVDITPLMDVIFLLLIFFMVATTFHEETRALDVALPRAENPRILTLDERVLSITVSEDKRIFLNEREIEPRSLKAELEQQLLETGYRQVLLKGDQAAPYASIAGVIDALAVLEVDGISFAVTYTTF